MSDTDLLSKGRKPYITGFIALNVVLWAVALRIDFDSLDWAKAGTISASGITLFVFHLLTASVKSSHKDQIIFGRSRDPMPGCRAFSELAPRDARININKLKAKVGTFPSIPEEQNALWYGIYDKLRNHPAVWPSHRDFRIFRDLGVTAFLGFFVALGLTILFREMPYLVMTIFLATEFVLLSFAARNCAEKMVTAVLAIESAS